jgi:hypothetical protein
MAATVNTKKKKQSTKKLLAQKVSIQLNSLLLPTLTRLLGKKKLEKRITKAAKLLVAGIKPASAEKQKSKTTRTPNGKAKPSKVS